MLRRLPAFLMLALTLALSACLYVPTYVVTTRTAPMVTVTTAPATTATTTATDVTTTLPVDQPFVPSGYPLLQDELDAVGIPAAGDVRLLVFVIDFYDAPLSAAGVTLSTIATAFNGTAAETAWESLASFYEKSSFGHLSLTADVFPYRAEYSTSYYENDYLEYYTDSDLIYEMMTAYDDEIDYADYDANGDGYIDGVYVVYTAPVSYDVGSELWWAYQDYYVYEDDLFDGVEPYYFCWSGTDFMLEAGSAGVDAHTLIHETGHMLGLDDYYDYDDADLLNSGGLGGADLMDNTVGDHSPISKILLGWIVPLVVTSSMTVDIGPYVEAGETILVIDVWRNTIFDEYLLISYYTPEGLFAYDQAGIFTTAGLLFYHVDARIGDGYDENSAYWTVFSFNNTDTAHKFLKIIEADGDASIDQFALAEEEDLFRAGDVFRGTIAPGYDWYQRLVAMDFTITVVSLDAAGAVLVFVFDD